MKSNLSRFFQFQYNVTLFRKLPPSVCRAYFQAVGKLYYLIRRKEKRLIETNIRDVLKGRPESAIRQTCRDTFKGIFMHYFEKMFAAYKEVDDVVRYVKGGFTVQNEHVLRQALSMGRGVILVTAHWGAVEFIPWVLASLGYPTSVILECQTEGLKRALQGRAAQFGVELLTGGRCRGEASIYLKAIQSLGKNRVLMTECDEVDSWRKKDGRTIELFGKKLYFDNTLDILAARSRAPVVGVFLKRLEKGSYTLICEPISVDGSNTARTALTLWQKYVTDCPEQWYQWKKWQAMKAAS